jgi:hypothetical protein
MVPACHDGEARLRPRRIFADRFQAGEARPAAHTIDRLPAHDVAWIAICAT